MPSTASALAALTDRWASRLAHTLSKYVPPSVGTKCGSRPYSICRTTPDGVVMLWHGQIQQRGEKPAPRTARRPAQPCRLGAAAPGRSAPGCPRDDQSHPRTGGGAAVRPGPSTKIPSAVSSRADVPSWWLSPLQQHNTASPPRSPPYPSAGTPLWLDRGPCFSRRSPPLSQRTGGLLQLVVARGCL